MSNQPGREVLYSCQECKAKAYSENGHIRIDHLNGCRRWIGIQIRYPKLYRLIVGGRVNPKSVGRKRKG